MTDLLQGLYQDHKNLGKLLTILDRELAVLQSGKEPDYEVVEDILDYCMNYPDKVHHPKEDLVMRALEARDAAMADKSRALEDEHRQLAEVTKEFHQIVKTARQGGEPDKIRLLALFRRFVETYWSHMEMEEEHCFPRARDLLNDEDWEQIAGAMENPEGPLFSEAEAAAYQKLRFEIVQADGERC